MNSRFDRIISMMFISTVITDRTGEPLHVADTGNVLMEDDDCD